MSIDEFKKQRTLLDRIERLLKSPLTMEDISYNNAICDVMMLIMSHETSEPEKEEQKRKQR